MPTTTLRRPPRRPRAALALLCALAVAACAPLPSTTADRDASPLACAGAACVRAGAGACVAGRATAQFRAQQPPPAELEPGARARVAVTFANCGGEPWTRAAGFALVPHAADADAPWGVARVELPADVPPGAEVTIPFELVAPDAPGAYPYAWAIARPDATVLQESSPLVNVAVRVRADCHAVGAPARFVTQQPPAPFAPTGGRVRGSVTFANCSAERWSRADGFVLTPDEPPPATDAPPAPPTWGTRAIELPEDVAPGSTVTVALDLPAPSRAGAYRYAWRIARAAADGGTDAGADAAAPGAPPPSPIGDPSPALTVTVLEPADCGPAPAPAARFVRQNVPDSVGQGETARASVTFANCGNAPWDRAGGAALVPFDDAVAAAWGADPIALPLSVGPGYQLDVGFDLQAPARVGTYPFRWAVAPARGARLEEPSAAREVVVRCVPRCAGRNCGDDGCGGSCGACGAADTCDAGVCRPSLPSCGALQWWNSALTYQTVTSYGYVDTDLAVSSSTPVQLRHASRLDHTGVYGWGYMPEFTDLVTGRRFRFLHLRPQHQNATSVGRIYPAGYIVGLSGGDTYDTGYPTYSTGAHLCVQTPDPYRVAFPAGRDDCR